jgi:hypothetical protein
VLADGQFVAVVGASPRPHLDFYGFPTANAHGSILDFRPRGAVFDDGATIGSPVLAFASRLICPVYASVEVIDDGMTIRAIATGTLDDDRQTFEVATTYRLRPGVGIIDVRSLLLNTGRKKMERVRFSLHDEATPVVIRFDDLEAGLHEVVVRDTNDGSVFFRTFRDDPLPLIVMLPPGTYTVTGNLFPAVSETVITVGREETECTLVKPALGRVRIAVRNETDDPVPGKVTFLGLDGTPSPYFQPHDPVKSGRACEEIKNSVFPGLSNLELAHDAFIVVEVTGKGSLYPVVQARSRSGLQADAVTPYALTNPVFVDVYGNGRFDPPLPHVIRALPPGEG